MYILFNFIYSSHRFRKSYFLPFSFTVGSCAYSWYHCPPAPGISQCVAMECEDNYSVRFLKYLSDFVANIRPDDPLPVRAPSYKVTENEIDGQILDIVRHYLNNR